MLTFVISNCGRGCDGDNVAESGDDDDDDVDDDDDDDVDGIRKGGLGSVESS